MPPRTRKIRRIIPISGKDSLCTAIIQKEKEPYFEYEYIFCDVGSELPEVYHWLNVIEKQLGIKIVRVGKNLLDLILSTYSIPSVVTRFCTAQCKIQPMAQYLEDETTDEIISYIGYRYDEKDRIPPSGISRVKSLENVQFTEKYPLIESQISLKDVYRVIHDHKLSLPDFYWKRLYDAVYDRCGPATKLYIDEEMPEWERQRLFCWRMRSNCGHCIFMRLWEWIGLLEFHPDYYEAYEKVEYEIGNTKSDTSMDTDKGLKTIYSQFTWQRNYTLQSIRNQAKSIFDKRVQEVYTELVENRGKSRIELDLMGTTSCGALCGK